MPAPHTDASATPTTAPADLGDPPGTPPGRPRVVVLGGGFGGLSAVKALVRSKAEVDVTLVDRSTSHVFQPLLYQCATGVLSAGSITRSLRSEFADEQDVRTLLGEAEDLDPAARTVTVARPDGSRFEIGYDHLVIATGTQQSYFGHPEYAALAPGLKTLDDVQDIRRRIFQAFEMAETLDTPEQRAPWLTFVVAGGGPTGVEISGQIREMATITLADEFRTVDPREARVVLVDGGEEVLRSFGPSLGAKAHRALDRLGVEMVLGAHVTDVRADGVTLSSKDGSVSHVAARTVLWTAGQEATPFARAAARALGAGTDRAGRVRVEPDLTVPGHPEVFVIGDLIDLAKLPGLAEVAMQGGRHAARSIAAAVAGEPTGKPFRYLDLGSAAYVARGEAVIAIGRVRLSGPLAWVGWGAIHIAFLTGFSNRASTMVGWFLSIVGNRRRQRATLAGDLSAAPQPYLRA